jgi:enoyl-CoA hydratase/carnithine racemase
MQNDAQTEGPALLVEQQAGVIRLTLNRPRRRNALSRALLAEMEAALEQIASDSSARVVVICGSGEAFCAGHDLSEMVGRSEAEYRDLFTACSRVMQALRRLPQPVIARVHGIATAAGCQLVASCDLAVASTDAQFAAPGVKIGLFCTTPMIPLMRAVPAKFALEMLFTGAPISAERALQAGLINRVVTADRLDAAVQEYCDAIVASSPYVLRLGKQAFYNEICGDEAVAYAHAVEIITGNACHPDAQTGIKAFLQKQTPIWNDV